MHPPADAESLRVFAPCAAKLRMLTNAKQSLMALHLACTYLAAKNIDKASALLFIAPASSAALS